MNIKVWVGFSDGKPHVYTCETDGKCVAVFPSRAAGREKYEDVRAAWMVIDQPKVKKVPARHSRTGARGAAS